MSMIIIWRNPSHFMDEGISRKWETHWLTDCRVYSLQEQTRFANFVKILYGLTLQLIYSTWTTFCANISYISNLPNVLVSLGKAMLGTKTSLHLVYKNPTVSFSWVRTKPHGSTFSDCKAEWQVLTLILV